MGDVRQSYPRFRRTEDAPRLVMTEDDTAILRHVHRHRFLRTTDIYRLFPDRTPEKLSRRMARLFRAGYLDRPVAQIDYFRGGGSQPLVYGLDAAGARYLAAHCLVPVRGSDWKARNRSYTRENLDHTLAIASFMVDVELACRRRDDLDLIPADEIIAAAPAATRALSQPDRWRVSVPWQGFRADVTIAPDAIFGLRKHKPDGSIVRTFAFLEVDRGHMTIAPSEQVRRSEAFLYRSTLLRKFLAYCVSHQEGVHAAHFGLPPARVLFLTTSSQRAQEMQRRMGELVIPHIAVHPNLCLFGAGEESAEAFDIKWINSVGDAYTLGA